MSGSSGIAPQEMVSRLSYYLMTSGHTTTGIANIVLNFAKNLTLSTLGYVSVIDPKTRDNICHTLTGMIGDSCRLDAGLKGIIFPIGEDGKYPALWGHSLNTKKSFYCNEPQSHEASVGLPAHHNPIESFLSVPAMLGDEPCGQICVANTLDGYDDSDLATVEKLAEVFSLSLKRLHLEEGDSGRRADDLHAEDMVSGREMSELLRSTAEHWEALRLELTETITENLRQLVNPYLEKMMRTNLSPEQQSCLEALRHNLEEAASPFIRKIKEKNVFFTPQELQVAVLIKSGLQTKDVASQLDISINAVNFHRKNIRKKLAISHKQVNLQTYLLSLEDEW